MGDAAPRVDADTNEQCSDAEQDGKEEENRRSASRRIGHGQVEHWP